jgi:hypothetical protein
MFTGITNNQPEQAMVSSAHDGPAKGGPAARDDLASHRIVLAIDPPWSQNVDSELMCSAMR